MEQLLIKYPNRVPVLVQKSVHCKTVPDIDKKKYLVPDDYTLGQFVYTLRKRMNLKSSVAIFVFVDNLLPATSDTMLHLYTRYKSSDNMLHITYSGENTFGAFHDSPLFLCSPL